MRKKIRHLLTKFRPQYFSTQFETFVRDESIGGKLILVAAILSLVVVNSPLRDAFQTFWQTYFSFELGRFELSMDLRHWVNEGLMAFFFLVVGLEIKRELVKGELRDKRTALLPIGAAVGGMVVPALIYLYFNTDSEAVQGWGIPIATDIAFAVAVLGLLSRHVPLSLKVFLLTLAIADDIGAIIVIALFYAEIIHYGFLVGSAGLVLVLFLLRRFLANHMFLVILGGVGLWFTTHRSGIHASIVGAAMGLLAPADRSMHKPSISERVEKILLPFTTFFVLPVFALANAGFVLSARSLSDNGSVALGIILGLVIGKMLGIVGAAWLLVRFGLANLPSGTNWRHIIGVGFIAGIGFTVSIFITELAFADRQSLIEAAKISIFIASALSAVIGSLVLLRSKHST